MKIVASLFWSFILIGLSVTSTGQTNQQVTLQGKLVGFGPTAELERFDDTYSLMPKSMNIPIPVAEDSSFSISIPLDRPTYYRIGRNKLYLSPGDNMVVYIDLANSMLASFKGTGSIANTYLKSASFPKAGSFLEAGRNLAQTPEETVAFLREEAALRNAAIQKLSGVSKEFKRLESGRIRADYIKSIYAISGYAGSKFYAKGKDSVEAYVSKSKTLTKSINDSLTNGFVDASMLQVEVYRDILDKLDLNNPATAKDAARIKDWQDAVNLAYLKIRPENDKSKLPALADDIAKIKTPLYRQSLELSVKDKMKFGNGDPAIDIKVRTADGGATMLSSLKGKVIYIDIWATWCGPCMAEMPHLETLKQQYATNPDVSIVSLSIDNGDAVWLKNLAQRKPGGIQWRIDRPDLVDYNLVAVPRYILIDKNFIIAEIDAPRASDEAIPKMIDKLLSDKKS